MDINDIIFYFNKIHFILLNQICQGLFNYLLFITSKYEKKAK